MVSAGATLFLCLGIYNKLPTAKSFIMSNWVCKTLLILRNGVCIMGVRLL